VSVFIKRHGDLTKSKRRSVIKDNYNRGFYRGNSNQFSTRVNGRIRVPEVRVIDDQGNMMGIMNTRDALTLAQQRGVDLVEISPNAVPPVCKIVDFGKYKYEEEKKLKDAKKHQTASKVKELKFHINIASHDYTTKINHAIEFLEDGDKVKLIVELRRREMSHRELGMGLMQQIKTDLTEFGNLEAEPKAIGRNILMFYNPLPANQREKLKKEHHEIHHNDGELVKSIIEKVLVRKLDKPQTGTEKEFKNSPFDRVKT